MSSSASTSTCAWARSYISIFVENYPHSQNIWPTFCLRRFKSPLTCHFLLAGFTVQQMSTIWKVKKRIYTSVTHSNQCPFIPANNLSLKIIISEICERNNIGSLNVHIFHFLLTALVKPPFPSNLHRILRPWGISPVATMNPTWHPGDGAIWYRPQLAIRPRDSIPTLAAWRCLMSTYEQTLDCQVATPPRHGGQAGFCHCCSNPGASKGGLRFPK